jgi:hypothetical protein
MMQPNNAEHSTRSHRVIASLNREQVDFLDKIGKDAQFSSGVKLSRTQILAAMVNALKRLNLTGEGVQTVSQFEQRIVDAMTKTRKIRNDGHSGFRTP